MVFQKKGATPKRNFQGNKKGKKADSDSGDSDDQVMLQKTPVGKQFKGRQSLSEKKVSFAIPTGAATKTPSKTPQSGKKPPTPANKGKTSMQEFKGVKASKKKDQDESDDSDDLELDMDDDDDDFDDEDLNALMKKNTSGQKKAKASAGDDDDDEMDDDEEEMDDDDEDDDDDDDEDDDDEDDDDDENEEEAKKPGKQDKTPVKGSPNNKNNSVIKGSEKKNATPKKVKQDQIASEIDIEEDKRRHDRDCKTLFIGNLPKDIQAPELKTLSSDILDVILPSADRMKKLNKSVWAFVNFVSEAKAEENFKLLQNKKLRGQLVNVDYIGDKSLNKKNSKSQSKKDYIKNRLFVSNIPMSATIAQVAQFFPKAYQISLNQSLVTRTAAIFFLDESHATEAYESNKTAEINGEKISVLHCVRHAGTKRKRFQKNKNMANRNSKKIRLATAEDSD